MNESPEKGDQKAIELVIARLAAARPAEAEVSFVDPEGGELSDKVASLEQILKTLELLPVHEPPPALTARTLARVNRQGAAPRTSDQSVTDTDARPA